ncbi:MAG: heme exporter protein CcmD [Alphaproteobacteria bacterium]
MDKYAIYIWWAYGIAFAMLAWMALSSVWRMRSNLKKLTEMEELTGRRRNRDNET